MTTEDRLPHVPGDILAAGRVVRRAGYTIVKRDAYYELRQRLEQAEAELAQWRTMATIWEGPQECLERECEDYFTEEGDELAGLDQCSHVTVKTLTPEQIGKALEHLADNEGIIWELPEVAEATR